MVTPEELQLILGIHPDQVAASQAVAQSAQGDTGEMGSDDGQPPPVEPRPISSARDDEEKPAEQPRASISAPSANEPRAISAAPVSIAQPMGPAAPAEKEEAAPVPSADIPGQKPDTSSISSLMRTPIRPTTPAAQEMDALQGREAKDRASLNSAVDTPAGITRFQHKHHILGPIVRGLEIAGSVVSPGVMAQVPGTTLHRQLDINQKRAVVDADVGDEAKHQAMTDKGELDESRRETAAARDETNRIRRTGMEEKFIAGSEHEDTNSPTGYSAQNFKGEWKPYTPPASYKPTKGESFADVQQQREKEAGHLNLKGKDREIYIANGKLSDPATHIHVASAASEELHEWQDAFKAEHGRAPSADEVATFKHGATRSTANQKTFKDSAAIDKYSNDWYAKQRKSVLDEKAKVHSLNPEAADDDKQLQQEYTRIEGEYRQRAADFENQKKNWYTQVQGGKPVTVEESEQGAPQVVGQDGLEQPVASVRAYNNDGTPAKTVTGRDAKGRPTLDVAPQKGADVGGGFKYAQPVMVDGKSMYITGYNPQTRKPRVSPNPPQ